MLAAAFITRIKIPVDPLIGARTLPVLLCIASMLVDGEMYLICLLQRVTEASVRVDGLSIGSITKGLLVLVGFEAKDANLSAQQFGQLRDNMAKRLLAYRVFPDDQDRMNLNVLQAEGGVLLVPQFTLAADTSKGLRPGFHTAAAPDIAKNLFNEFVSTVKQDLPTVQQGRFGADMKVSLVNDGPVTFWLQL